MLKSGDDVSYAVKSTEIHLQCQTLSIAAKDGANYSFETEATVLNPSDRLCSIFSII